jgi:outer membrane protein
MKKYFLSTLLISAALGLNAEGIAGVKEISLLQCARDAKANSYELKRLKAQAAGAQARYEAAEAGYYPSISLDAKGGWVSEVPELELGPIKAGFGDKWSYSAGPTLEYILFDYGQRSGASKSAKAAWQAAQDEADFAEKTLLLGVRQTYFTLQQDLERMYFSAGQLKVAQKQIQDINSAFRAGAKSNLDVSMAQKQELRARINIASARAALGAHLRDLFKLTGADYGVDPKYPADWRVQISEGDMPASAVIKADRLEDTLKDMKQYHGFDFDENSLKLAALDNMAQYYEYLAESFKGALYPVLGISGGAYFEYPNGPIKEHIFLGRAGVSLRMPLFEGSKNRKQAAAGKSQAQAAQYQKMDLEDELQKLFYLSKSLLYSLDLQADLTKEMIAASQNTASLTYDAYNAGVVTFLEVDSANLGLLESRIALTDIYIESLNRLAVLDSLGKRPQGE